MAARDYSLDESGDLKISGGDFFVSESEAQHLQDIILSHKGEWRQHPLCGVGLSFYLNAPSTLSVISELKKEIHSNLKADGFTVRKCDVSEDFTLTIDANRP